MPRVLRFLEFTLDVDGARLSRDGTVVALQPKVLDALLLLTAHPGELLTKERLLSELWPDVVVGEEALTQVVRKLRQALGDDPREPRILQTVMKRGYRFLPEVAVEPPPDPSPAAAPAPPAPWSEPRAIAADSNASAPHSAGGGLRARSKGLVAIALVAVAAAGVAWIRSADRTTSATGTPARWRIERLTSQPEREQEGAISPDGKSFAVAVNLDGQFDLQLALFAGGRRVRLTESAGDDEYCPRFARDGGLIVFTREPIAGGKPSVWAIPPLGGDERLLVADASHGDPSPDGRRVAYVRYLRDGRFALRVRELETEEEIELAVMDEWLGSVAWSPDGAEIAFVSPRAVFTTPAARAAARRRAEALENVRSVAWEPGGSAIVHDGAPAGGRSGIFRVDLETGLVTTLPAPTSSWHPSFGGDARRLLLTVEHKSRQLWRVGPDGRGLEALPLPTTAECFDVDPGGRRLAINDWEAPEAESELSLIELASGSTRTLGAGLCPAFSPDGERLAYLQSQGPSVDLVVHDLVTGERRRVARDLGTAGFVEANLDRRPAWAPDGRSLVVERSGPGGWSLDEVNLTSGARRELLAGEIEPAAFAPDGRTIALCGATPLGSGLHLVDAVTGATRRVGQGCSYRAAPVWSEDGATLRLLRGERREPVLETFDLAGRPLGERLAFERPRDPAFWGIFDARPLAGGGWVVLSERYEGDLFLLERDAN